MTTNYVSEIKIIDAHIVKSNIMKTPLFYGPTIRMKMHNIKNVSNVFDKHTNGQSNLFSRDVIII